MSTLTTGKIVEILFEKAIETHEHQMQLIELTNYEEPDRAKLQNSGNVIWKPIQQHAPILEGFDLTGQEQGIIEETVPIQLGTLKNDFVRQRIDDVRDTTFWERRGEESGMKQASELNKTIANAISLQGGRFYRSTATSGYDFIAEAQALLNETQQYESTRSFILNDRTNLKFGSDLAGRQTLQGRPEQTWKTGQIGQNVAQFDVYTGSYLPNLVGGANPATTVTASVSEKPEGGTVDAATGQVTNIDYRVATISVTDSSSYNVGDKVQFANAGTPVNALGLSDKTNTNEPMTFTIVEKPNATSVKIYPKPIAEDDPALTALEAAYANIDTQILATATMDRLNTDASAKVNLFMDKSAVEVLGGTLPAELFTVFDGMKVVSQTMSNGQVMYMVYDGQIEDLSFRYRIFTWYGVNVVNPSNCGVAISA